MKRLLVSVLGDKKSGKSHTWNTLFNAVVRTGSTERRLYFNDCEYVNVFLVSGSAEERGEYVGDLIIADSPKIVLCSIQYIEDSKKTFNHFIENDYFIYCHWLNPGRSDKGKPCFDNLGLADWILSKESMLGIRNGTIPANNRVNEMKEFIFGWAKSRNLVISDCE